MGSPNPKRSVVSRNPRRRGGTPRGGPVSIQSEIEPTELRAATVKVGKKGVTDLDGFLADVAAATGRPKRD